MNDLLIGQRPNPYAEFRLFCFPYAGGTAAAYHRWPQLAPRRVHVCGVELPGHGTRLAEDALLTLPSLVRHLADRLEPHLDTPYALFGHSMGGLVAFELARLLRDRAAPPPLHLFVSATAAPGLPRRRRSLHAASDEEVLDELRDLGGTPPELLADRELMALVSRTLRADYTVMGTYEYRPAAPLDLPITVFGGRADMVVPPADLRGWRGLSNAGTQLQLFPGDHFFLHAAAEQLLRTVAESVQLSPNVAALAER